MHGVAEVHALRQRKQALEGNEPRRLVCPEGGVGERVFANHPSISVAADPGVERVVHEAGAVRCLAEKHHHSGPRTLKFLHV